MGVHVAVAGGGTRVFGAKGLRLDVGSCKRLTKKAQAQRVSNNMMPVSTFQVKSLPVFFFNLVALGFH
jgi:hypothetical protein